MVRIAIIAHQPMASALLDVGLHVFPDAKDIYPFDIQADSCPDQVYEFIFNALFDLEAREILILTDLYGATPSNISVRVAERLNQHHVPTALICGVNPGMVISAIAYRAHELPTLIEKVVDGGTKSIRTLNSGHSVQ